MWRRIVNYWPYHRNPRHKKKRAERPLPGSSTIQLGISFQDCGGSGSGSVPSWAQRANEPLVPELDLSGVKRDVQRDLKEIKKASEEIARLTNTDDPGAVPVPNAPVPPPGPFDQ